MEEHSKEEHSKAAERNKDLIVKMFVFTKLTN